MMQKIEDDPEKSSLPKKRDSAAERNAGKAPSGAPPFSTARESVKRSLLLTYSLFIFSALLIGCRDESAESDEICDPNAARGDLVINEVVSKNDGVWIDSTGQTEDIIELVNQSNRLLELSRFSLRDSSTRHPLTGGSLAPNERIVLFADDDVEEGDTHLSFKLSSQGESLTLESCEKTIDQVALPSLASNVAYARFPDATGDFSECRYASPDRENGAVCAPPDHQGLSESVSFAPYEWPVQTEPSPVSLSELALRPATFIELKNSSEANISLDGYRLYIGPIAPGQPLPTVENAQHLLRGDVDSGGSSVHSLTEEDVAEIAADDAFEGVVRLFDPEGEPIDTISFMRWPEGATLARPWLTPSLTLFCQESTPGANNECTPLRSRDVGDRVRGLRTFEDFATLSEGSAILGTQSVKFVIDIVQGDSVHLLRAENWALHYTFIREIVEGKPPLDRCDPTERASFNQGWNSFSITEYFSETGRSYFLGTFSKHGSAHLNNVEFALGDAIPADSMKRAFFAATSAVMNPLSWSIRPQSESQIARAREIEGDVPLVPPEAPFADLIYQPLTHGDGYGLLTFVPASELQSTPLGSQVILVTDDVPNDIPLVGGLITEAFQTPLAHVNVLSQNRGTPNMALKNAQLDRRIADNLGKLVRLSVSGSDFSIEEADPDAAARFWEEFIPSGPQESPRLDVGVRDFVSLDDARLTDLPAIGAKAAGLAEMTSISQGAAGICSSASFQTPRAAFAIPVAHFIDHFRASGARDALRQAQRSASFATDPIFRADKLREVRELVSSHPVDPSLLEALRDAMELRFGGVRVRLRSSSNAEDLPGFNGAGLYTSFSAELDNPDLSVEDGLRGVWASLYNARAYDERELARIDHSAVAMGVLVHEAFRNEAANGVAVSRNVLNPVRGDIYYLNAQAGEASVTNPAPGVATEAVQFQWPPRQPLLTPLSRSSLNRGQPVLSEAETISVSCGLRVIHNHFRPLVDPDKSDPWFAMEIEFKLDYPSRELLIKQARPHAFGGFDLVGDCREL